MSGTTAGGLIGELSKGVIKKSYTTGLVKGESAGFAFIGKGELSSESEGNYYFELINEVVNPEDENEATAGQETIEYMLPYSTAGEASSIASRIKSIDYDVTTYNVFVGDMEEWNPARAYDSGLVQYYSGKYTLKTVDELTGDDTPPADSEYRNWNQLFIKTHYGDWPAPEIFVINAAN